MILITPLKKYFSDLTKVQRADPGDTLEDFGICYLKLPKDLKYKYELKKPYRVKLRSMVSKGFTGKYFKICKSGWLEIFEGYRWDGPSGPTYDTPSFIRGSLIHDMIYQLMRMGIIDASFRRYSDIVLKETCAEDGMNALRRQWVYAGVRMGGASSAAVK